MTDRSRRVGYGPDLVTDLSAEALRRASADTAAMAEESLVTYLRRGSVLAAANGPLADDLLDPSARHVIAQDLLTDGRWLWPAELAYYVERYHVRLHEEFVGTPKLAVSSYRT
jgi:hypothetical protein